MKRTFNNTGPTFSALYAAQYWLKQKGYSYGSLQALAPVAIFKGECAISKWRNLSREERNAADGVMTSSDFREGSVTVELKEL
jgi:hypothetical protein